jgi:hypothetical protein
MSDRSSGALAGIRVIDLTRVLGGPYCTQILGDHGAEVIKVEPPQGDETRDWGPPFDEARDASYFLGVNRNKRSLGLDLSKPEGHGVLLRLIERADLLIENFKPGAMEKWGLGYRDVLEPRFPRSASRRVRLSADRATPLPPGGPDGLRPGSSRASTPRRQPAWPTGAPTLTEGTRRESRQGPAASAVIAQGGSIVADTASGQARRRFLKLAAAGMAALPLCGGGLARRARAQERVAEDEELAQQLGYRHDASEVDPDEWPEYQEGHVCANCQLYQGAAGDEWGPCEIFGGELVAAGGWCLSWLEREA